MQKFSGGLSVRFGKAGPYLDDGSQVSTIARDSKGSKQWNIHSITGPKSNHDCPSSALSHPFLVGRVPLLK